MTSHTDPSQTIDFDAAPKNAGATNDARRLPISVVVPAFNEEATLGCALETIAAQKPARPAEVIVVDDGSTDATADIAARLGAKVIVHDRNRGLSAARNSGIEAARNPWIAFLDSDDQWLPDHLAALWRVRTPHVLVANTVLRCGPDPNRDQLQGSLTGKRIVLNNPSRLIYPGNQLLPSATLARRDVIERVGRFRDPHGAEDLDLWIRMLECGTGLILPSVRVIYGVHPHQMTQDIPWMHVRHVAVARRFEGRPWYSDSLVERWQGLASWNNVRSAIRGRRPLEAAKELAGIARSPQKAYGALRSSPLRARAFRRAARVARDGGPSVAIVVRHPDARQQAFEGLQGRPAAKVNQTPSIQALIRLIRRPSASVIVDSRAAAVLLRLARVQAVRVTQRTPFQAGDARRSGNGHSARHSAMRKDD